MISGIPVVMAPRGEFSKGAVAQKAWKKKPFILLAHGIGLYRGATWQASSVFEQQDIVREAGVSEDRITVAPNLTVPPSPDGPVTRDSTRDTLRIVFLSLDYAISVLSRIKEHVKFDIIGPIGEPDYWQHCKDAIADLPENVSVEYRGAIPAPRVPDVLSRYDLFFLPTVGENFGHVIAEALSVGTPVLISDQTPWRNLAEEDAGWDISLQQQGRFVEKIDRLASMNSAERHKYKTGAWQYACCVLHNNEHVEHYRELFGSAIENGTQ
jgi:hypothetical protein